MVCQLTMQTLTLFPTTDPCPRIAVNPFLHVARTVAITKYQVPLYSVGANTPLILLTLPLTVALQTVYSMPAPTPTTWIASCKQ